MKGFRDDPPNGFSTPSFSSISVKKGYCEKKKTNVGKRRKNIRKKYKKKWEVVEQTRAVWALVAQDTARIKCRLVDGTPCVWRAFEKTTGRYNLFARLCRHSLVFFLSYYFVRSPDDFVVVFSYGQLKMKRKKNTYYLKLCKIYVCLVAIFSYGFKI